MEVEIQSNGNFLFLENNNNMQLPLNIILPNKYTSGGEFVYAKSNLPYEGYYYELNNKFFIGKTFNPNSPELLKITSNKINPFLKQASTYTYGLISNQKIDQTSINSLPFNPTNEDFEQGFQVRYFAKKLNVTPFFIKEISKEDFEKLKSNPLYQVLQTEYSFNYSEVELNSLDQKMPGLKEYLKDDILVTSSEEDGK